MRKLFFVALLALVSLGVILSPALADEHHKKGDCKHKCSVEKRCSITVCNFLDTRIVAQVWASDGSSVAAAVVSPNTCNLAEAPQFGKKVWVSEKAYLHTGVYVVAVKKPISPGKYEWVLAKKVTITKDMVGCKKQAKTIRLEINPDKN